MLYQFPSTATSRPVIHLLDRESDMLGDLALQMEHRFPVVAAMLLAEIERAEIHGPDTLPPDAVTIGSEVEFVDEGSGSLRRVRIVMPADADIEIGRVSVLTPIGAGLIRLTTGQSIEWPDLEGRERRIRILSVTQPPLEDPPAAV